MSARTGGLICAMAGGGDAMADCKLVASCVLHHFDAKMRVLPKDVCGYRFQLQFSLVGFYAGIDQLLRVRISMNSISQPN